MGFLLVRRGGAWWRLRRLFLEDGILVSQPSPPGNAIKLSGRTFLAPHRGSSPKGLCKRTGFLGVKRRENPVRRHFERSEMRGQHYGVSHIVRWPLACPYCLRHFPRRGEARRYVANDFLNLIAFPSRGRCPAGADRVTMV